jgi:hypothetical protein
LNSSTPIGIVSASAAAIAKYSKPTGIGAEYMLCIHASRPSGAIAASEAAIARWPNTGLREKTGRISEIVPNANSRTTT